MKRFHLVVAATHVSQGIGRAGTIPWKLKGDMQYFKDVTSTVTKANAASLQNAVIMGKKTYLSIPVKFRPLVGRINVVLSRSSGVREELGLPDTVLTASSLEEALQLLSSPSVESRIDQIFVIGGASVYKEALESPRCGTIYLTKILKEYPDMDTFFPIIPADKFTLTSRTQVTTENDISYQFCTFDPVEEDRFTTQVVQATENPEEQQYLDLIKQILETGVRRGDRTGTGTISRFGVQMRFSLRDNVFPLLTTKKVFFRGVAEELLWFVAGCTNANVLSEKGVKIWDGNGSREFLDKSGLSHREVGDLGPVYGFQVRVLHCSSSMMSCLNPY
nr:Thymidylate synthase [uncultured bacterium]